MLAFILALGVGCFFAPKDEYFFFNFIFFVFPAFFLFLLSFLRSKILFAGGILGFVLYLCLYKVLVAISPAWGGDGWFVYLFGNFSGFVMLVICIGRFKKQFSHTFGILAGALAFLVGSVLPIFVLSAFIFVLSAFLE